MTQECLQCHIEFEPEYDTEFCSEECEELYNNGSRDCR